MADLRVAGAAGLQQADALLLRQHFEGSAAGAGGPAGWQQADAPPLRQHFEGSAAGAAGWQQADGLQQEEVW